MDQGFSMAAGRPLKRTPAGSVHPSIVILRGSKRRDERQLIEYGERGRVGSGPRPGAHQPGGFPAFQNPENFALSEFSNCRILNARTARSHIAMDDPVYDSDAFR